MKSVLKQRETMLKNSRVVLFSITLKSWSGRKLLDPTTYMLLGGGGECSHTIIQVIFHLSVVNEVITSILIWLNSNPSSFEL